MENDQPCLYTCIRGAIRSQLVDVQKERFGYRYLNWTPEGGFFLNGHEIPRGIPQLHHGASELRKLQG